MRLNSRDQHEVSFDVSYTEARYNVKSIKEIKINGILFQQDEEKLVDANVEAAAKKIDAIFKKWSARHLSVLGKILITKTFGIAQVVYLLQSVRLLPRHFIKLNQLFYKFIWNRHYLASKAPERIKREIVNTPVKFGGLGMLDLCLLDKGLKIKALARLNITNHPFLSKIVNKIELSDFFFPKANSSVDKVTSEGIKFLKEARHNLIGCESIRMNAGYIVHLRNTKIENVVSKIGKSSLAYFCLKRLGMNKIGELDRTQLGSIKPFIGKMLFTELDRALTLRVNLEQSVACPIPFYSNNRFCNTAMLTSKEIRDALTTPEPICIFKIGAIGLPAISLNWGRALAKVPSVRHQSCLLRVAHGEVYTKEKLFRFGLRDNPNCPRCGGIEDLEHKFATCEYVDRIWQEAFRQIRRISDADFTEDKSNLIIGLVRGTETLNLSLQAEILQRIMYLRDEDDYLLRPKVLVRKAIEMLYKREINQTNKTRLRILLDS